MPVRDSPLADADGKSAFEEVWRQPPTEKASYRRGFTRTTSCPQHREELAPDLGNEAVHRYGLPLALALEQLAQRRCRDVR